MCSAGIGQDVVLSIPSGCCDVDGSWYVGWLLYDSVSIFSMMILECWRRCCSVCRCRCMVVTLAYLL